MKILVCISHVPDTTSKINFKDNDTQFDTSGVQFVINPIDEFGLTKAIILKEKQGATVEVVNVGTAETEATIRKAIAIGADEGIRINAEPKDGFFVAKQLAELVKNGDYDLIITGKESIDYNGGMVGGMLAELLEYPFVDRCIGLSVDGNSATVEREIDGGKETSKATLPLVIAAQKGLVEDKDPRIPNMRGIMAARKKVLNIKEPVDVQAVTQVEKYEKPQPKKAVKMVSPDNLDELINLLHNEAKVI